MYNGACRHDHLGKLICYASYNSFWQSHVAILDEFELTDLLKEELHLLQVIILQTAVLQNNSEEAANI